MRRAKQEWKEQARRAKDESRRAREEAQRARRQAKEAQERARAQAEEVQRIARQVQDQVQDHFARGDWPTGVREGLAELAKEFGEFGKDFGRASARTPAPAGRGRSGRRPTNVRGLPRRLRTGPGPRAPRPATRPATWTACSTASATTSATRPATTA